MHAERANGRKRALPVYPSAAEVHRMLDACQHERDRVLLELCWHTGGRISEVIQIRAGDLTARGVRMRNLKQSVPAEKHVYLSPAFLARLRAYAAGQPGDALLVGRLGDGGPITRRQAWNIVTAAARTAGILKRRFASEQMRPIWPHSLRHATAINLLDQGVPVNAVQRHLGHASLASTAVYTQLTDEHTRRLIAGARF